jgi:hypothetical protein
MRPEEVEQAFGITGLRRPRNIAPNQPFLYKHIYRTWGWLMLAAGILAILFTITSSSEKIYEETFLLQLAPEGAAAANQPVGTPPVAGQEVQQEFFREGIELKPRRNIEVAAEAPVNNSWLDITGDFINEETGEVQPFGFPIEYYHGFDGGESWSEGSQHNDTMLSSMPRGRYLLRLHIFGEAGKYPSAVTIRIRQGVPRFLHVFLLLLFLSIIPLLVLLYHWNFEHRRWQDSEYGSSGGSD